MQPGLCWLREPAQTSIVKPNDSISLVCPVSVGREAPLQALLERLDRAAAGDGSLVLVGGDAGIGKSRLIRELKTRPLPGKSASSKGAAPAPNHRYHTRH